LNVRYVMKDLGLYRIEEQEFIELYVCALILMGRDGTPLEDIHNSILDLRDEIDNDMIALDNLPQGSIH